MQGLKGVAMNLTRCLDGSAPNTGPWRAWTAKLRLWRFILCRNIVLLNVNFHHAHSPNVTLQDVNIKTIHGARNQNGFAFNINHRNPKTNERRCCLASLLLLKICFLPSGCCGKELFRLGMDYIWFLPMARLIMEAPTCRDMQRWTLNHGNGSCFCLGRAHYGGPSPAGICSVEHWIMELARAF